MNILHPTSKTANRTIDIIARVILVIADLAIIQLFWFFLAFSSGGEEELTIPDKILFFIIAATIFGVVFSFVRPRLGSILLFIPVIALVVGILWFVIF